MDRAFFQLLLFGIAAALANVIGGAVLLPSGLQGRYKPRLKYLLALGAGFMLAVTIFEILPKVVLIWQNRYPDAGDELFVPMTLLMAGYLLTQFFEHTVAPHFHLGEEMHADELISTKTAYTAVGGLLIHTFFDGVSIAAAAQIDTRIGLMVFVAVLLHKFPEGFTIGSMILAAGKGFSQVMLATSLIGLTTLLGVLVFYFVGSNFDGAVAYTLPVAAGVTLYVAASDLIPEVNHHGGHRPGVSMSVFAGVALFFGAHFLLHAVLGH
jgi:zinc transporter ZupT